MKYTKMKEYNFIEPSEAKNYCFFEKNLESDPLILFHITPAINFEPICREGFKFKKKLQSVSYAYNSSSCLAHRGQNITEDYVAFVVRFETLKIKEIRINPSDIHVDSEEIQPEILGYCFVPKEYKFR